MLVPVSRNSAMIPITPTMLLLNSFIFSAGIQYSKCSRPASFLNRKLRQIFRPNLKLQDVADES